MRHTKKLRNSMGLMIAMAWSGLVLAQNTSYDANTVPIGGTGSVAFGQDALGANSGDKNTAIGIAALKNNTDGSYNVAAGFQALINNTTGGAHTATGYGALYATTQAKYNVANGYRALYFTTTGSANVAVGANALYNNTIGNSNVANGYGVLYNNTEGSDNTAAGARALYRNTTGSENAAHAYQALYYNTTGSQNTASGYRALYSNTTGNNNTGLGALTDISTGTSIRSVNNSTALGNGAIINASNKVRIGNSSVTVVEGPVAYTTSDARFKTNIKEEDVKGLAFIKKLRPVVYNFEAKKLTEFWTKNMPDSIRRYHLDQDFSVATKIRQSGFIAQEVEQAAKAVQYDFNGIHAPENQDDYYSIAYSQFVVPLVKAVQEQQRIIETLQQQVNDLLQEKNAAPTNLEESTIGSGASLEQNVPNPFTLETMIAFNLPPQISNASLIVYDLSGKQLKSLPIQQRGESSITLTADQLAAGMYIYSIVGDGKIISSKRMVVAEK